MRTNIDIDDELMTQAMAATGAPTKKAAVEASLRQMVQIKNQGKIRELRGKVVWRGPDDDWFASDEEIREKRRLAEHAKLAQTESATGPEQIGGRGRDQAETGRKVASRRANS